MSSSWLHKINSIEVKTKLSLFCSDKTMRSFKSLQLEENSCKDDLEWSIPPLWQDYLGSRH